MLTFKEWLKLPEEERARRYREMSDHDKFIARCSLPTDTIRKPEPEQQAETEETE